MQEFWFIIENFYHFHYILHIDHSYLREFIFAVDKFWNKLSIFSSLYVTFYFYQ